MEALPKGKTRLTTNKEARTESLGKPSDIVDIEVVLNKRRAERMFLMPPLGNYAHPH